MLRDPKAAKVVLGILRPITVSPKKGLWSSRCGDIRRMASGSGNGGDGGTTAAKTLPRMARVSTMLAAPPALSPNIPSEEIRTVEWHMLDKQKFYPLSMLSSFSVRCFLYPLTLVRTRLQVQHQSAVYNGTFDAFRKILKLEGVRGFYRGFWVSSFQVVSGIAYVSTYEGVRHVLGSSQLVTDTKVRAFLGGAAASVVGQTIIVPFDVISQHLMLMGQQTTSTDAKAKVSATNQLAIKTEGRTKGQIVGDVVRAVYHKDGLRGFYRGYGASLCTYVPSSASWWTFYHFFQDAYDLALPTDRLPRTLTQCVSAMTAGCATAVITNPLDLVRTRVQVQRKPIPETIRWLWETEGVRLFKKGLTARMLASSIYSVCVILGYETVKKYSVYDEYKDKVRW